MRSPFDFIPDSFIDEIYLLKFVRFLLDHPVSDVVLGFGPWLFKDKISVLGLKGQVLGPVHSLALCPY